MASSKNKGPLLTSVIRGAIEHIPPEWRARLGIKRLDQENPTDVDADAISGDTINSEVNQTRTNERKKTNNLFLVDPAGISLVQEKRLGNGQIATTTRTVVPSGTALVPPTDSIDAEQENLGIGWMLNDITEAPLPGPTIESSELDKDGVIVQILKTRRLRSTITEDETVISGVWRRTTIEGETNLVATEVVKVRTVPGNPMDSSKIDEDGIPLDRTQTYIETSTGVSDEHIGSGLWVRRYVENIDGSELVSFQWVESRPIPGNPIPSGSVDPDGIEVDIAKTLKDATTIAVGEPVITAGIWSEITMEPVSDLVAYEVVKAREVPGNPMIVSRSEKDGFTTTITRTMKDITTITEGETLVGSTWTRIFREDPPVFRGFAIRVGDRVAWEMKETRTVGTTGSPITTIPSAVVERDHEIATSATMVKKAADITPSATESGGIITTVNQKEISDLVSEQITTTKPWLDEKVYEISIPIDVVPLKFRSQLPTTIESHIHSGTFSIPFSLGGGEFSHYKKQITKLLYEERITSLDLSGGGTFTEQETTELYGGGILDKVSTLAATGTLTIDTGPFVVSSEILKLGNGFDIKITRVLHGMSPAWPVLTEYDQDPETQALITTTYQVVDASGVSAPSIVNGVITRYKKIDVWRSLKIVETYSIPAAYDEQRFMAHQFPSLWDASLYNYSTACGPTGPIRQGFSSLVQARLHISYTTSKITISGLTLIPNTHHLVHDIVSAVLNDSWTLTYVGTCSGSITIPPSSPTRTTYVSTIQGTEQLISGESVLWRAGLYKNSALYVTML